jgi:1-acyl-sn-glycerol-3-phosphate acyltransferase
MRFTKNNVLALTFFTVLVYHGLITLMRLALFSLSKWTVIGEENIPRESGGILVSNHVHILDPPLVAASSRTRRLRTMAKQELFDIPLIGWVFDAYGAYSVRRTGRDIQSLRKSLKILEQGEVILLFAEGTRSSGGPMRTAHDGAGLIALRSGEPVIPVTITGSNIKLPGIFFQWMFGARPEITVCFGKPVNLAGVTGDREGISQATHRIMSRIAEQLPADMRGPYATIEGTRDCPPGSEDSLN